MDREPTNLISIVLTGTVSFLSGLGLALLSRLSARRDKQVAEQTTVSASKIEDAGELRGELWHRIEILEARLEAVVARHIECERRYTRLEAELSALRRQMVQAPSIPSPPP